MITRELIEMHAQLPIKLSQLSKNEPEIAIQILQAWGDGTKTLNVLWSEVTNALEALESLQS